MSQIRLLLDLEQAAIEQAAYAISGVTTCRQAGLEDDVISGVISGISCQGARAERPWVGTTKLSRGQEGSGAVGSVVDAISGVITVSVT